MGYSVERRCWKNMRDRCNKPQNPDYKYYGGRGIVVCPEWNAGSAAFRRDMGAKPTPEHTIERIDVNGNYEPSNCCWIHKSLQNRNRRNSTRNNPAPIKEEQHA